MATPKRSVRHVLDARLTASFGADEHRGPRELLRGSTALFEVTITNVGTRPFPSGSLEVSFREHGPSPVQNPFHWSLTEPRKIQRINKGQHWSDTFSYEPVVPGICVVTLKVTTPAKNATVDLRGFRSSGKDTVPFFFWPVDHR